MLGGRTFFVKQSRLRLPTPLRHRVTSDLLPRMVAIGMFRVLPTNAMRARHVFNT